MRLLEDFYREPLEAVDDPLSQVKRDRVQRDDIKNAIARIVPKSDPHTMSRISKSIYKTLSDFTHGSYNTVMELFGGYPERYHMHGMKDTPREGESWSNYSLHLYRCLLLAGQVARYARRLDLKDKLQALSLQLNEMANCAAEWKPNRNIA